MLRFAIAIENGNDNAAWGVIVPDLPGCFSAGDTLDEAMDNAREAIVAWVNAVIEDGGKMPEPKSLTEHALNPEYAGYAWGVVEVDPLSLDNTVERVNITLQRRVLARIDAIAEAHGDSRSKTIARLALEHDPEHEHA